MTNTESAVIHELNDISRRSADPAAFIAAEERHYESQLETAADRIAEGIDGCRLVLQCGPSSVGKTTTANKLSRALQRRGVSSFVVSLDDFYRGIDQAPRLPNGQYDYESPLALDLPQLRRCIVELTRTGQTLLPRYDFKAGAPAADKQLLKTDGNTAVIFEGIHAFSPLIRDPLAADGISPLTVFINTRSRFVDRGDVLLCRRDIRLSRRLLRDVRTRGSSFANTMAMWAQVLRGEDEYIFPHKEGADLLLDTTMGYEPCVLAPLIIPQLQTLYGTPFEEKAKTLEAVYARFPAIDLSALPKDSLLREFVG